MERDAVRSARGRHFSLAAIARALGVTRQAAHQRLATISAESTDPETPEDRWWRERRQLDAAVERLFRSARTSAQAPMA